MVAVLDLYSIKGPTPSYEDHDATIHQIQEDKLTPRIKHLGIMRTWLHEQETYKTYVAIYCRTDLNKSDMNTKAHGGQILQTTYLCLIGYRFYPPKRHRNTQEIILIGNSEGSI